MARQGGCGLIPLYNHRLFLRFAVSALSYSIYESDEQF